MELPTKTIITGSHEPSHGDVDLLLEDFVSCKAIEEGVLMAKEDIEGIWTN